MNGTHEVFPHFQPILSVASGRITGYEALARRRTAGGAIVSAGDLFAKADLSEAERTELDRKVRWQALEKFAGLDDGETYLTLNIAAAWIDNVKRLSALPTLAMLERLNIDRRRVIIEITEDHADLNKLKAVVRRYRRQGLRVALDDFGAGSSQLLRVLAIQPDLIKIDMRLFKQASKGGLASEVVNLLTRLGKRTGCQIICEGVESDEEFLFGLRCGAQYMQGFLFSPAQAEFQAQDRYRRHIVSLRGKFHRQRVAQLSQEFTAINHTKALIYRLAEALQGDFNLNELAGWDFNQSRILRFFLCDNQGDQISPNFNFIGKQWAADASHVGDNWCWRPYFFQLLAMEVVGDRDRIATSERYRDFGSDVLCKTLSLRLDDHRLLMVDVMADE